MSDWLDALPSPAAIPIAAYKHRKKIQNLVKRLQLSMSMVKTNVVVSGSAGAGKTALTQELCSEEKSYTREDLKTSLDVEKHAVEFGDWTKIFSVLPGQNSHERQLGLSDVFENNSSLEGVIHVVDYGYTSIRSDLGEKKLVTSGYDTITKLRDYNLGNELKDFKLLCDSIIRACSNGKGPKWLIIAVNKVDLYYDELGNAKEYYHKDGSGPFVDAINELIAQVGRNNLMVKTVPVCPLPRTYNWNSEIQRPNLETFEESKKLTKNFVTIFNETAYR